MVTQAVVAEKNSRWRVDDDVGLRLLTISALIRLALIGFGAWQDRTLAVKYTDVDYAVFTDAAAYMAAGGSPYQRSTYRYSPLLAAALLPNVAIPIWGKLLFSLADLAVGWLCFDFGRQCESSGKGRLRHWGAPCAAAWLFNPFTMAISTRGNGEALVLLMLLLILRLLRTGKYALAGFLYGLAVHWRVYPAIYAISSILSIAAAIPASPILKRVEHVATFGASAGVCFILLGMGCYLLYGDEFVQHALLYHATRLDHRHNFSVFFYSVYLEWPSPPVAAKEVSSNINKIPWSMKSFTEQQLACLPHGNVSGGNQLALLPQVVTNLFLAANFHADLPFCWLLQTISFVSLNKVCTAQYFVWYFGLMPLCIPALYTYFTNRLAAAISVWAATQLNWLAWAYRLEFQGGSVYLALWASSCFFLCVNTWLMLELMQAYRYRSRKRGKTE